jgi:hypothetical protein
VLHPHYASCLLADLLLARGALDETGEVLRRALTWLPESPDVRHVTRLRARSARLLRLSGRPDQARAMLSETEKGIQPDALSPEHVIWLVEHALLAGDRDRAVAWVDRLEALSERTGIAVPPWERRLVAEVG